MDNLFSDKITKKTGIPRLNYMKRKDLESIEIKEDEKMCGRCVRPFPISHYQIKGLTEDGHQKLSKNCMRCRQIISTCTKKYDYSHKENKKKYYCDICDKEVVVKTVHLRSETHNKILNALEKGKLSR